MLKQADKKAKTKPFSLQKNNTSRGENAATFQLPSPWFPPKEAPTLWSPLTFREEDLFLGRRAREELATCKVWFHSSWTPPCATSVSGRLDGTVLGTGQVQKRPELVSWGGGRGQGGARTRQALTVNPLGPEVILCEEGRTLAELVAPRLCTRLSLRLEGDSSLHPLGKHLLCLEDPLSQQSGRLPAGAASGPTSSLPIP